MTRPVSDRQLSTLADVCRRIAHRLDNDDRRRTVDRLNSWDDDGYTPGSYPDEGGRSANRSSHPEARMGTGPWRTNRALMAVADQLLARLTSAVRMMSN